MDGMYKCICDYYYCFIVIIIRVVVVVVIMSIMTCCYWSTGYTLPHSLLVRLVHRFVDVDWRLDYSRFINAMALITKAIGRFEF